MPSDGCTSHDPLDQESQYGVIRHHICFDIVAQEMFFQQM